MDNKQAAKQISENLTSIYGYAFARLYDKNDVDDLTSEIVYEILRSSSKLKNESAFWAFVWKIAENTFRKFIRRKEHLEKANLCRRDPIFRIPRQRRSKRILKEKPWSKVFSFCAESFRFCLKHTARFVLLITSITKPVPKLPKNSIFPSIW